VAYTLQYPTTSPTATVTLPNAALGNIDRLDTNRIVRPTRHNIFKSVRDSSWPNIETKLVTFNTLTAAEKNNLINFLTDYRGLEIRMTDHDGDSFDGIIISDDIETITVRDDCSYDITIEFLGSAA